MKIAGMYDDYEAVFFVGMLYVLSMSLDGFLFRQGKG